MNLKVVRRILAETYTIGDLYIEKEYLCNTLEDTVRHGEKIHGKTAIPAGRYEIRLTYSRRFKQVMPQLMNVPNFEGVRIHSGNTSENTEGCLLVGKHTSGDWVANSRDAYNDLMDILTEAKEKIFITLV